MQSHWHKYALGFSAACSLGLVGACSDSAPSNYGVGGAGGSAGAAVGGIAAGGGSGAAAVTGSSGSLNASGTVGVTGGGGASAAGAPAAGASAAGAPAAGANVGGSAGTPTGGSGGTPPYMPPVSSVNCLATPVGGLAPMIADFEDGLKIIAQDGRGGIWFEYADGTGTQSNPIPIVASDLGGMAMHVLGKGFTNWGSGIGSSIAFDFGNNVQCPYDASLFDGVQVRVKGSGVVHLRVTQVEMTPATASDRKGSCDPNRDVCDGHYEVSITLTSSWVLHSYKWSDLAQPFGNPQPFDPKNLLGVSFEFHAPTDYDFWADDVAFVQHGASSGEGGAGGDGSAGGGR